MAENKIKPSHYEEEAGPLLIAGISETYTFSGPMDAPSQWERFTAYLGKISGQKNRVAYGVCFTMDKSNSIEYLCGVEVSETGDLPESFTVRQLPENRYVVFSHSGHVSTIRKTIDAVGRWVEEQPNLERAGDAGFFIERYGQQFDPQTGTGDIEIWLPVEGKY